MRVRIFTYTVLLLLLTRTSVTLSASQLDNVDIDVLLKDILAKLFDSHATPGRGGPNDYYQPHGWLNDMINDFRESNQYNLNPEFVQRMKYIFRYVPLEGTPFGDFLAAQERSWPDLGDLSVESLLEQWLYSTDFKTILQNSLMKDELQSSFANETDPGQKLYEGCREDMHKLFKPVTTPLVSLVAGIVCDALGVCPFVRTVEAPPFLPGTIPLIDSYTKLPSGILQGMLSWVGSFDQCHDWEGTSYNHTDENEEFIETREFAGKYCRVGVNFRNENNSLPLGLSLGLGFCIPDTCSTANVSYFLNEDLAGDVELRDPICIFDCWSRVSIPLLPLLGLKVNAFCGHEKKMSEDGRAQACVAITLIFVCVAIIATVYDVFIRRFVYAQYFSEEQDEGVFTSNIPSVADVVDMTTSDPTPPYENIIANENQSGIPKGTNELNGQVQFSLGPSSPGSLQVKPALQSQLSVLSTASSTAELLKRQQSMMSMSTVWDTVDQESPTILERCEVALLGFSLYSNLRRVCRVEGATTPLDALNGIRFLTLAWTVLGHTFLLGNVYTEAWTTANLIPALQDYLKSWAFQPVINFHFSADTMFVLSGFLITYGWLRQAKRNGGKVSLFMIIRHYIHNYWKLASVLMMTLMVYTTMYYYLTDGPMNAPLVSDAEYCRDTWWADLLLLHNLVKTDTQCLAWTWYVALVFQLHVVIPVVLIAVVYIPALGYAFLAVLYAIHISVLAPLAVKYYDDFNFSAWYRDILTSPWCRAGPYLIGVALALLLRKTTFKFRLHPVAILFGWACALVCILAPSYGTYSMFENGGIDMWDKSDMVAWEVLGRTAWGLGIAWIIFVCATGNGGVVNSLLSWRAFAPLSKLSYCWFIIHPVIIFKYAYSARQPLYLNNDEMSYRFLGHLAYSAMYAILLLVAFQYPLLGLERAFLVKSKMDVLRAGWLPAPKRMEAYEDLDWQKKEEARTWAEKAEGNLKNDGSDTSKL